MVVDPGPTYPEGRARSESDVWGRRVDELIWDVSKAAPVHAALAGVLATLAIALLTILSSIVLASPAPLRNGVSPDSRADVIKSRPQVIRLLVMATLLLLVSAVIWGGLAGQPSVEQMSRIAVDQSTELNQVLGATKLRIATMAAAAVTILAVGALALVAGMFELVTAMPTAVRYDFTYFVSVAFAVLAVLVVYQVVWVSGLVAALTWHQPVWAENAISLAAAGLVALSAIPQKYLPLKAKLVSVLGRLVRTTSVDAAQMRLAVMTAVLATGAYILSPTGSWADPARPADGLDYAATVLTLLAGICAAFFSVVSAWALRPEVNPARSGAPEGVVEGDRRARRQIVPRQYAEEKRECETAEHRPEATMRGDAVALPGEQSQEVRDGARQDRSARHPDGNGS